MFSSTQVIAMVTDLLVPDKVNIMWSSRQFKGQCQLTEKWFGTPHSIEGIHVHIHIMYIHQGENVYMYMHVHVCMCTCTLHVRSWVTSIFTSRPV